MIESALRSQMTQTRGISQSDKILKLELTFGIKESESLKIQNPCFRNEFLVAGCLTYLTGILSLQRGKFFANFV